MELLIFGHAGAKVLMFPTRDGRFWEYEALNVVGRLAEADGVSDWASGLANTPARLQRRRIDTSIVRIAARPRRLWNGRRRLLNGRRRGLAWGIEGERRLRNAGRSRGGGRDAGCPSFFDSRDGRWCGGWVVYRLCGCRRNWRG